MSNDKKIKHSGNLREASKEYQIPLDNWIDLSTGINPRAWEIPELIPSTVWQRLPELDDDLLPSAKKYYGCSDILPLAGSQVAIQSLPYCRRSSRVAIVSPCYAEYPFWWQQAGHTVYRVAKGEIDAILSLVDVLILINPNNPDANQYTGEQLQNYHQQLSQRGGWLIVDEAFIDTTPEESLLKKYPDEMPEGLIVLRSFGKFFGLAGIRLGFIAAHQPLLAQIAQQQGSWGVSHPARWLGALALADDVWHQDTIHFLQRQSGALFEVMSKKLKQVKKSHYFCYCEHPKAKKITETLAKQGIWIRYFEKPAAIRLGLPKSDEELNILKRFFSINIT